jgi:hypothetical protein
LSFTLNQVGYALALHQLGLPYQVAYPVAGAAMSLVYFAVTRLWILRIPATERIASG